MNPWSGALQVSENSDETGLPEAAQYAQRAKSPPRDWVEIGETPGEVKEVGGVFSLEVFRNLGEIAQYLSHEFCV
jgi:hypothetical protein